MEYSYLIENKVSPDLCKIDINKLSINIICYNITNTHKYPFIQFMMTRIPECSFSHEKLTLPVINVINNDAEYIKQQVLDYVKQELTILGYNSHIEHDMYKGLIFLNYSQLFAFIDISKIDLSGVHLTRRSSSWFVLTSEIINTKSVCNIPIDINVIQLFTEYPEIGLLHYNNGLNTYNIPDAVYTISDIKKSEFYSVFGNCKTKEYKNCREFYYFYRSFDLAVQNELITTRNNSKIGINRYALFVEGKFYFENNSEFTLTDKVIDAMYPEPCIIICYIEYGNKKPDMLVKDYNSFVSLSYHEKCCNDVKII